MNSYLENVQSVIEKIGGQQSEIEQAGQLVAESITNDGIVYMFGCGHSHIITEEVFYRAGGLAPIHPIFHVPLMLHEGASTSSTLEKQNDYAEKFISEFSFQKQDILIVISTSGRNPVPVDVALFGKKQGIPVIVITSKEYTYSDESKHKTGQRLIDVGDVVIDNFSPIGDAVLTHPKTDLKFSSTSTIGSVAIVQSILADSIGKMLDAGHTPPIFISGNVEGSAENNNNLVEKYKSRIPMLK